MLSVLYSLARLLIHTIAVRHADEAKLRAEVLALRRQVRVSGARANQIARVRWTPGSRMVMAALRDRIPKAAWPWLLVKPETVLGWHRALVRRKWAAYRGRPPAWRAATRKELPCTDNSYSTEIRALVTSGYAVSC